MATYYNLYDFFIKNEILLHEYYCSIVISLYNLSFDISYISLDFEKKF